MTTYMDDYVPENDNYWFKKNHENSFKELTFDRFNKTNIARCLKWHPQGTPQWSNSDQITAIVGELGELASLIKMRNRERDCLVGNKFSPTDEMIAKEAADVFIYLDLFCAKNNINLGHAVAMKFNEVSERVGFSDRIENDTLKEVK